MIRLHPSRARSLITCFGVLAAFALSAPSAAAASASVRWVSRYDRSGGDEAVQAIMSPDGSVVYGVGQSRSRGGDAGLLVLARDAADGSRRWVRWYGEPGSAWGSAYDAAVSPDGGRVFVVGVGPGPAGGHRWVAMAVDAATGATAWIDHGPRASVAEGVAIAPSGHRVFVTGEVRRVSSDRDVVTRSYSAASGKILWSRRTHGRGKGNDAGFTVVTSADGATLYVAGYVTRSSPNRDAAVIAYDARTGKVAWKSFYDGPGREGGSHGFDMLVGLGLDPDGTSLFAVGDTVGKGTGFSDYLILALDAETGERRWVTRYDGAGGEDETAWGVAVSGTDLFVTGLSQSGAGDDAFDAVTIAYHSATGAVDWVDRYDRSGLFDGGWGCVLSPDGSTLYVTGVGAGDGTGMDVRLLSYATADGARTFMDRFDGRGHGRDGGSVAAVSPDGTSVYLGGYTEGTTTRLDALMIAYTT